MNNKNVSEIAGIGSCQELTLGSVEPDVAAPAAENLHSASVAQNHAAILASYSPDLQPIILTVLQVAHPACNLFPLLPENELRELGEDIRTRGLQQPIIYSSDGSLVDGRNRLIACHIAGIQPTRRTWQSTHQVSLSPTSYIVSVNLKRRHLNVAERTEIGLQLLPMLQEEAAKRRGHRSDLNSPRAPENGSVTGRAVEIAAKNVGVSPSSLKRAKKIKQNGSPQIQQAVRTGELSLSAAVECIDSEPDSRRVESSVRKIGTPRGNSTAGTQLTPELAAFFRELPHQINPPLGPITVQVNLIGAFDEATVTSLERTLRFLANRCRQHRLELKTNELKLVRRNPLVTENVVPTSVQQSASLKDDCTQKSSDQ